MSFNAKSVGIIDVGSNSIKLLVATKGKSDPLEIVRFEIEETRIGEGTTGDPPTLSQLAIKDGSEAIDRLVRIAHSENVSKLEIVATSAVRDATNRLDFKEQIAERSGVQLNILSGSQEANYIGKGLQCDPALKRLTNFTLLDLGGGSMEHIRFVDNQATDEHSMQLGCVRLSSRFVSDRYRPLPKSEEDAIVSHVKAELATHHLLRQSAGGTAVLTGGTASIIAKRHTSRPEGGIAFEEIRSFKERICQSDQDERITTHRIPKPRADIFPAALVILETCLKELGCEKAYVSSYNLRMGLAKEILDSEI